MSEPEIEHHGVPARSARRLACAFELSRRLWQRKLARPARWRSYHGAQALVRRDGRVVEGTGFENRRTAQPYRGFESLSLRHISHLRGL